jgi:glycerol-3-phosphate dehydrogenase
MEDIIWNAANRRRVWSEVEQIWDIVIIGGGITGAGILREATRLGLRSLLVEQRDFAWGTSSRSSKLVHGGLRYLRSGQVALTRASVQGREQLLADGPGLVDPLGFLLADYEGDSPGRLLYSAGLTVYDLMAMQWSHRYYNPLDFQMLAPYISPTGLRGGFQYQDAQTDDARLVMRVLREAVSAGGVALNYVKAKQLVRHADGRLSGVVLEDRSGSEMEATKTAAARVIINATGAWADELRGQVGAEKRIRPLRGSHLIFPAWRFPLAQAVSVMHPLDGRPVFAFPWEGVTLVGTTDVDCPPPLDRDPSITADEVAYLMAAITAQFPALNLSLEDVISSFAGIRPVIGSGKVDPSDESRDHVIWQESGLLTVTGGKLTTFRQTARAVLERVCDSIGDEGLPAKQLLATLHEDLPILNPVGDDLPGQEGLSAEQQRRLLGRYGAEAADLLLSARPDELETIPGTTALWAELGWSARVEGVVHLEDLLLRRLRLGLLLERGGESEMPRIEAICRRELGWDDARWNDEVAAYRTLWRESYSLPPKESIPDWNELLAKMKAARVESVALQATQRRARNRLALLAFFALLGVFGYFWFLLKKRHQPGEANV